MLWRDCSNPLTIVGYLWYILAEIQVEILADMVQPESHRDDILARNTFLRHTSESRGDDILDITGNRLFAEFQYNLFPWLK